MTTESPTKERKRRVRSADGTTSTTTEEETEVSPESASVAEDVPKKRGRKPAALKEESTEKKSSDGRGRPPVTTPLFSVEEPIDEVPGQESQYATLVSTLLAEADKGTKWTPINPQGRRVNTIQSALMSTAKSRGVVIETRTRTQDDGTSRVYARVKPAEE